jgi:tetratricopeptide (TPR) repeat protein
MLRRRESRPPHSSRWLRLGIVFALLGAGCFGRPAGEDPGLRANLKSSEAELRQALELDPDDAGAHFALGRILGDRGEAEEAAYSFRKSVELDPALTETVEKERRRFVESYQEEAEEGLERGNRLDAGDALDRAEAMAPKDPRTAYLRGMLHLAGGDAGKALPFLRAAWESDPDDKEYRRDLREAMIAVGQGLYQEGQHEEAWEVLNEARELQETPDLDYLRGMVAYARARNLEDEEKWAYLAWAEDAFRSVLDHGSGDEDARFNLGAVLLASEQYEEAAEIYRRLIADNVTDGGLYLALSRAHSMSGQTEAALAEEAIGKALRAGAPVDNPAIWGRRAADRFPESDLALGFEELGPPQAVYTYTVPGGALVEVWFYWSKDVIRAFKEGGRVGSPVYLER